MKTKIHITISEKLLNSVTEDAKEEGRTISNMIEQKIISSYSNQLAKHIILDGQPERAIMNYLSETYHQVKGKKFNFEDEYTEEIQFLHSVMRAADTHLQYIEDSKDEV